jgi:hypothetical protein
MEGIWIKTEEGLDLYIMDYPYQLIQKQVTEEGQRILREMVQEMDTFFKEANIVNIVNGKDFRNGE